jgi:chemotaxis protein CheZ
MPNATKAVLQNDSILDENLKQAKQLVKHLEAGDSNQADLVINELCLSRENKLFHDLGKLTRELHEPMSDIGDDARLQDIMHNEMPDAKHNLDHVIELTEDATNKTLTAVEQSSPVLDALNERAVYLQRLLQGHMKQLNDNNKLSFIEQELEGFLDKVCSDIQQVNINMNTILMAQGYQDISGQIIQRVGKMVQDVEHSLIDILQINSNSVCRVSGNDTEKNRTGHGPAIPATKTDDVLNNQDDVDDLLSTLGF